MRADNPFTRAFIETYPLEAARVLEEQPTPQVAALLQHASVDDAVRLLESMVTPASTACLQQLDPARAASLIAQCHGSAVVRIVRGLAEQARRALLDSLSAQDRRRLERQLSLPKDSVGILMRSAVFLLPDSIDVNAALHRLEHADTPTGCEIYVVDAEQRLAGMTSIEQLLKSRRSTLVRDILHRRAEALPMRARLADAREHQAWKRLRTMPVVEADGTVAGTVAFADLERAIDRAPAPATVQGGWLSLAEAYWTSLGRALDSSMGRPGKSR